MPDGAQPELTNTAAAEAKILEGKLRKEALQLNARARIILEDIPQFQKAAAVAFFKPDIKDLSSSKVIDFEYRGDHYKVSGGNFRLELERYEGREVEKPAERILFDLHNGEKAIISYERTDFIPGGETITGKFPDRLKTDGTIEPGEYVKSEGVPSTIELHEENTPEAISRVTDFLKKLS